MLGDDVVVQHIASITLKASELHHMLSFYIIYLSGEDYEWVASHAGETPPDRRG